MDVVPKDDEKTQKRVIMITEEIINFDKPSTVLTEQKGVKI